MAQSYFMLGGGKIEGYKICGALLCEVEELIKKYENGTGSGLVYAMGDGNHSLASAKAYYEELKKALGEAAGDHPASHALVEVVDIYDPSIEFEPIYRLLINCDGEDILSYISDLSDGKVCDQTVTYVCSKEKKII